MSAKGSALVGAAGEDYVLYQLHQRGLLAAPAPTGAPIADLIVFDPKMSVGSMVQVKSTTRRRSDAFGPEPLLINAGRAFSTDGRGERNSTVMSDAGAVVRFVRETAAREHAHTA